MERIQCANKHAAVDMLQQDAVWFEELTGDWYQCPQCFRRLLLDRRHRIYDESAALEAIAAAEERIRLKAEEAERRGVLRRAAELKAQQEARVAELAAQSAAEAMRPELMRKSERRALTAFLSCIGLAALLLVWTFVARLGLVSFLLGLAGVVVAAFFQFPFVANQHTVRYPAATAGRIRMESWRLSLFDNHCVLTAWVSAVAFGLLCLWGFFSEPISVTFARAASAALFGFAAVEVYEFAGVKIYGR